MISRGGVVVFDPNVAYQQSNLLPCIFSISVKKILAFSQVETVNVDNR